MAENIHINNFAALHLMGDPYNVYQFLPYKNDMLNIYISEYNGTEEKFNKLFDFSIQSNFDIVYQLYFNKVTKLLINDEKYKIGDWFYIEDTYETRQWHGIGRISFDLIENKKQLLYYGEDTPYNETGKVNNNIFPLWLQNKINEKKDFDKYAAEDYIKYISVEEYLE
jgi:hypothetical protein